MMHRGRKKRMVDGMFRREREDFNAFVGVNEMKDDIFGLIYMYLPRFGWLSSVRFLEELRAR